MAIDCILAIWMPEVKDISISEGRYIHALDIAIRSRMDRQALSSVCFDVQTGMKMIGADLRHVSGKKISFPRFDGEEVIPFLERVKGRKQKNGQYKKDGKIFT